jgi:hypothetical protein
MPEIIHKLQPNRTMQLRGFDAFGAAAALHSATANSFKVSGVFRDAADFAVLILFDADNFYEHASIKYLPDFDFSGLTLQFDVHYEGLRPLHSPRFATIDWPYLDVIKANNDTARIRLSDYATLQSGTHSKATATFTIEDNELKEFDRVTLWYMNFAFDYLVPKVECAYAISGAGAGTQHRISIGATDYIYTELATDTNTTIATNLAALVDASTQLKATTGPANQINLRTKIDNEQSYVITSSASTATYTLYGIGKQSVAANLAWQINSVNWTGLAISLPLEATASSGVITIQCAKPGVDGNSITMYSVAKNTRLMATTATSFATAQYLAPFAGGSSDCTWRITLDFSALNIPSIRQMWFTFAPPIPDGQALADTEWQAEFSNWTLTGPSVKRELKVAGPDSVRVEEDSPWCHYTGIWHPQVGFYSGAFAKRTADTGATVEIFYSCNSTHDLYLGTTLFADRGEVGVVLNGDTETTHNFAVSAEAPIYARRKLRSSVPAGRHTATITLKNAGNFDFDFLEAVVPTNIPDPLPARTHASPAFDYSTDHTFKLPPARTHWILDQLGFAGPMNEYIGVFWWNQRQRVNATIPSVTVTLNGTFVDGDQVILTIGGSPIGKTVFPADTNDIIAKHLACFINENLVGVFATASGSALTIINRSPTPAYAFTFSTSVTSAAGSISVTGTLDNGQPGRWDIDLTQSPPLNRAARDWHADFCAQAASRSRELVIACSMELVNPPAGFAAVYPNGAEVVTDVGFASLKSTHCTFNTPMLNFQKAVYLEIAGIQAAAGLTPSIQFGEFLWWFFTNYHPTTNPNGGMALYDSETTTLAAAALGRPLHIFRRPTDDPTVNGSADAIFLRNLLRDHISALRAHVSATYPTTKYELLYPYDVNHPVPAGVHQIGGALNYFLNFPEEYRLKATSGLDTLKMEALDFGAWSRSLDLSRTAIEFPIDLGWPKDSLRYLVPVFRGGSAWEKEYLEAKGQGIPVINFWAFDHFNLYNLNCREPKQFAAVQSST